MMGTFTEAIETVDLVAEAIAILIALFAIYRIRQVSVLLSMRFKVPLRFFMAGLLLMVIALNWELLSEHVFDEGVLVGAVRDLCTAIGMICLSIASYLLSGLMLKAPDSNPA